jgi:hypothetical protein
MKLVVTAQAQTLPEDVYVVALLAVEAQNGAYGEQLVWQLQVAEGEYEGATLKAWTNASTAVNSKAVKWASAFAGRPFRQGEEIDLLALVGKRARAVVNQKQGHERQHLCACHRHPAPAPEAGAGTGPDADARERQHGGGACNGTGLLRRRLRPKRPVRRRVAPENRVGGGTPPPAHKQNTKERSLPNMRTLTHRSASSPLHSLTAGTAVACWKTEC